MEERKIKREEIKKTADINRQRKSENERELERI